MAQRKERDIPENVALVRLEAQTSLLDKGHGPERHRHQAPEQTEEPREHHSLAEVGSKGHYFQREGILQSQVAL